MFEKVPATKRLTGTRVSNAVGQEEITRDERRSVDRCRVRAPWAGLVNAGRLHMPYCQCPAQTANESLRIG